MTDKSPYLNAKASSFNLKAVHDSIPIEARSTAPTPQTAVGEFMVMAGGLQSISCSQGSKDVQLTIAVDRSTAGAMESQRALLASRGQHRPYFDFDHDDKQASFWPAQFFWADSPAPGVYARGEWSAAGKAAIEGKNYRAFSPRFHVDSIKSNPARVICSEQAALNMGGLVNNPAFQNNLPLWAKHAGASQQTKKQTVRKLHASYMTPEQLAELQAKITNLEQEITALTAANTGTTEETDVILAKKQELTNAKRDLEVETAKTEATQAKEKLFAIHAKKVEDSIKRAIQRGALAPKNEPVIAHWRKKCLEDEENLVLLDGLRGSAALDAHNEIAPMRFSGIRSFDVRASSENLLKEMAAIEARQRPGTLYKDRPAIAASVAELYAKEITPRLKEGDDIPLRGSNVLGTLAQTLVATRILELLTLQFPLLQSIWTDFSSEVVSYLDTIKTRSVGVPAVQTYNTTTGWPTQSDVTTTDVSMQLDQWKGVPIRFQAHEIAGTVRRLFDEVAPMQAYALGKAIVDDLYTLITSAYTNTVTAAGLGTFGRSTLIDIGGILDDAANPEMGRAILLNRPYYSALAKDNTIIQLAAFQRASIIEQGLEPTTLRDIEGFRVIKAVNLPATVISGTTVLKGFAFTRSAIVLATRLSSDYINQIPGAANGNLSVVTTPGGFSANLVQFVDHNGAYAAQRMDVIWGRARGQIAAGALLTDV